MIDDLEASTDVRNSEVCPLHEPPFCFSRRFTELPQMGAHQICGSSESAGETQVQGLNSSPNRGGPAVPRNRNGRAAYPLPINNPQSSILNPQSWRLMTGH